MVDPAPSLDDLSTRARAIFRQIVENYIDNGAPTGSRTLARTLEEGVSPATIRNTMSDLEHLGLLAAPHVSAGRVPTELGLRLFVDGLLELGTGSGADRDQIERASGVQGDVTTLLDRLGEALSGVTQGASLVLAPKQEAAVRHVDFVPLAADRALAILVFDNGHVENRLFRLPPGQTPASLRQAANFVNAAAQGRTLSEMAEHLSREVAQRRQEIDASAAELIESGLAIWVDEGTSSERLIVRGRGNLLQDGADPEELERIKQLFDDLERKRDIVEFLELADGAQGVRIFIGSENKLFSLSGSSLVVSPYMNPDRKIIGAVGVIGPTRLNYGRVVPIVDYTAQLIGRMLSDP